jgi:hypothetical protein
MANPPPSPIHGGLGRERELVETRRITPALGSESLRLGEEEVRAST